MKIPSVQRFMTRHKDIPYIVLFTTLYFYEFHKNFAICENLIRELQYLRGLLAKKEVSENLNMNYQLATNLWKEVIMKNIPRMVALYANWYNVGCCVRVFRTTIQVYMVHLGCVLHPSVLCSLTKLFIISSSTSVSL